MHTCMCITLVCMHPSRQTMHGNTYHTIQAHADYPQTAHTIRSLAHAHTQVHVNVQACTCAGCHLISRAPTLTTTHDIVTHTCRACSDTTHVHSDQPPTKASSLRTSTGHCHTNTTHASGAASWAAHEPVHTETNTHVTGKHQQLLASLRTQVLDHIHVPFVARYV